MYAPLAPFQIVAEEVEVPRQDPGEQGQVAKVDPGLGPAAGADADDEDGNPELGDPREANRQFVRDDASVVLGSQYDPREQRRGQDEPAREWIPGSREAPFREYEAEENAGRGKPPATPQVRTIQILADSKD
jgi:hypothetical protein